MPIDCIMCVPVQHLLLISQHERHSHHNKQKTAVSVHQEEQGALPVSLFIPYTLSWPPLCTCTLFLLLCNGHLMWLFVLYVLTAFLGLRFAVVAERTAHNLRCLPTQLLAVTCCGCLLASLFLHFSSFFFFFFEGGESPSCNPVCLHYCDVQLSRDRAVSGKHITKGRTWPIWRSVLVKVKLWMAPGIWSPQLPACIQLCFSYLIFYGAFGAVYRNNKAVFLRLYGTSLEVFQMCWFSFAESAATYSFQKLCVE